MSKRVIIIGSGWYGCYMGYLCEKKNIDYVIFEKSSEIFTGASLWNQNRLHLGYHYPRNHRTRIDSKNGFDNFMNDFPDLSIKVEKNIYAIHKNSLLDFNTYINIFKYENYDFEILGNGLSNNFLGSVLVDERFIDPVKSKTFFENLGLNIIFNSEITYNSGDYFLNNEKLVADKIFNATYGGLEADIAKNSFKKENFLSFIVKKIAPLPFGALTIMDGPFYSIYPYNLNKNLYTLTHVKYGVLSKNLTELEMFELFLIIKNSIIEDIPDFDKYFEFESFFVSTKYKPFNTSDLRSTVLLEENNSIVVCSGKIDTIFLVNNIIDEF